MDEKEIYVVVVTRNDNMNREFSCILHGTWYLNYIAASEAIEKVKVKDIDSGESGTYDYRIINLYR